MTALKLQGHKWRFEFTAQQKPVMPEVWLDRLISAEQSGRFVGSTGTGKTHAASALAVSAIHQGKRIRFFNAVDLVNQLKKEKQLTKAGFLAKRLIQIGAVIIDGLGYLPFPQSGGALLFHLISQPYEKTSLIIATNLNFAEWMQFFGDKK